MPGRDNTGPEGLGPFTGRGMGAKGGYGRGYGKGYGQGRRMRAGLEHGDSVNPEKDNSVMMELEEEIKNLRKQVESLEKRISDSEINK
ncbi:MAG: DUF5320 domain-containing protein [Cyclobacteriaceae bacterium]|nr:DUF5320 domain-containing protein [Cyclobacteriaceae bacterium]